jgi:predicted O-methyltransferase YrrM
VRRISHWTPRYISSRIALAIYEKQHPNHPWITSKAISFLDSFLSKNFVGIEWGSGRSTAWFASRIQHLVSVEDNPEWYQIVKEKLTKLNLDNTDYYLEQNQDDYVNIVKTFPSNSLDFALIDGSFRRSSCAVSAVDKIKDGGIIIVDNANWFIPSDSRSPDARNHKTGPASEEWQYFIDLVKEWHLIWTTNGVSDTALYMKN